jgi:hypothetical protein
VKDNASNVGFTHRKSDFDIEIEISESRNVIDKIRIKFRRNFDFVESKTITFMETLIKCDIELSTVIRIRFAKNWLHNVK